jgi:hypothetical protein
MRKSAEPPEPPPSLPWGRGPQLANQLSITATCSPCRVGPRVPCHWILVDVGGAVRPYPSREGAGPRLSQTSGHVDLPRRANTSLRTLTPFARASLATDRTAAWISAGLVATNECARPDRRPTESREHATPVGRVVPSMRAIRRTEGLSSCPNASPGSRGALLMRGNVPERRHRSVTLLSGATAVRASATSRSINADVSTPSSPRKMLRQPVVAFRPRARSLRSEGSERS